MYANFELHHVGALRVIREL